MSTEGRLINHWSQRVIEIVASVTVDGAINNVFCGGAENGQFSWIGDYRPEYFKFHSGKFIKDDIVLDVQGEKVGGYIIEDLITWVKQVAKNGSPVMFKVTRGGFLTKDLRQYLNTRFQKNSLDHDLQQTVRNNLYRRTIPCTTRASRPGELNGIDYIFLSVDEFLALERNGNLLESGRYEGNYYGTPRPLKNAPNLPSRINRQVVNVTSLGDDDDDNDRASSSAGSQPNGLSNFDNYTNGSNDQIVPDMVYSTNNAVARANGDESLPYGWERVEDPRYGVYYIDHINKKTQYERPTDDMTDKNVSNNRIDSNTSEPADVDNVASPNAVERTTVFTNDPQKLSGEFVRTRLVKGPHGLGFTIIGGDQRDVAFLQIKDVVPLGPAYHDGALESGDVLVNVNGVMVLGYSHQDILQMFQSMPVGQSVDLEVCRGYPLPFDPNDPDTEIVTTVAVDLNPPKDQFRILGDSNSVNSGLNSNAARNAARSMPDLTEPVSPQNGPKSWDKKSFESLSQLSANEEKSPVQFLWINILKGSQGFGFTIADSIHGQRVRQILDRPRCKNLMEGDHLLEINRIAVKDMPHLQVVQLLKNCLPDMEASIFVQRGLPISAKGMKGSNKNINIIPEVHSEPHINGMTKAALFERDLVSPKYDKLPSIIENDDDVFVEKSISFNKLTAHSIAINASWHDSSSATNQQNDEISPKSRQQNNKSLITRSSARAPADWNSDRRNLVDKHVSMTSQINDDSAGLPKRNFPSPSNSPSQDGKRYNRSRTPGPEFLRKSSGDNELAEERDYKLRSKTPTPQRQNSGGSSATNITPNFVPASEYQTMLRSQRLDSQRPQIQSPITDKTGFSHGVPSGRKLPEIPSLPMSINPAPSNYSSLSGSVSSFSPRTNNGLGDEEYLRKNSYGNDESPGRTSVVQRGPSSSVQDGRPFIEKTIILKRHEKGFGFKIIGGTEEGSQVAVGPIVPGGAADLDGRLRSGDELLYVDGICTVGASHQSVVQLMSRAGTVGQVNLLIRRHGTLPNDLLSPVPQTHDSISHDVTLVRRVDEGFGFVIISSVSRADTIIGRIIEGSPAHRCGRLAVGDRILAVNGIPLYQMHHDAIVNLIKESGYSIILTINRDEATAEISESTYNFQADTSNIGDQRIKPTVTDGRRVDFRSPPRQLPSIPVRSLEAQKPLKFQDQFPSDLEKVYTVDLPRGARGFGFSIRGGREFGNMPLYVLRVAEGGPADVDGRLKVGDQIIEINGRITENVTHADAIDLIQNGGPVIRLVAKRNNAILPPAGSSTQQQQQSL